MFDESIVKTENGKNVLIMCIRVEHCNHLQRKYFLCIDVGLIFSKVLTSAIENYCTFIKEQNQITQSKFKATLLFALPTQTEEMHVYRTRYLRNSKCHLSLLSWDT